MSRTELEPWQSGQDHVALYLLNGPEYLEATLAGYASRTAPFNVNYRYTPAELTQLFTDSSPAAIIYHQRFAPALDEAIACLPVRPLLIQVADESGSQAIEGALDFGPCFPAAASASTTSSTTWIRPRSGPRSRITEPTSPC